MGMVDDWWCDGGHAGVEHWGASWSTIPGVEWSPAGAFSAGRPSAGAGLGANNDNNELFKLCRAEQLKVLAAKRQLLKLRVIQL